MGDFTMSQNAGYETKRQASPCIVNDAFSVYTRRREVRASGQASGEKHGGHDVISEAIACTKKAGELRDAAIKQLLERRERIESDLKMRLCACAGECKRKRD
jgi:hypothetical protein